LVTLTVIRWVCFAVASHGLFALSERARAAHTNASKLLCCMFLFGYRPLVVNDRQTQSELNQCLDQRRLHALYDDDNDINDDVITSTKPSRLTNGRFQLTSDVNNTHARTHVRTRRNESRGLCVRTNHRDFTAGYFVPWRNFLCYFNVTIAMKINTVVME
jgi:hypothetical protein